MKTKSLFLPLLTIPLLTGCASIFDGGYTKSVKLDSNPEGAKVTISAADGSEVLVTNTPAKVKLERAVGYFRGADYKITFEKPGYFPYQMHVESTVDPWYFGNFIFGGLIGGVLVDPTTGAVYTLSPRNLNCNLISTGAPATPSESANRGAKN
jgi:hypothetical protein